MKSVNKLRALGWIRVAALSGVGALVFVASAMLSSRGISQEAPDLVEPIERTSAGRKVGVQGPSQDMAVAPTTPSQDPERLGSRVVHNPFGALDLSAPAGVAPGVPFALDMKAAGPIPASKPANSALALAAPPPPQTAPPLPFTAAGSIAGKDVADGKPVAFIRQQDHLLVVRAGDAIGQLYRVESVTLQRVEFTYLPLMQRQALALAP